jgi:YidC/Oxa1 family membrane protein insertase
MLTLLYNLFILPIETLMRWVLESLFLIIGDYGLAIILLSIVINILIFPLTALSEKYRKDDKDIKDRMKNDIANIKKSYTGRERYFYIKTIYKQFDYSNFSSIKASFGLLLQIPFFFAAFYFLGNYSVFDGVSFGFIGDLSKPDNLLFGQNLLPILMTIVNLASVYFYAKNMTNSDKYQLWGLSAIFLVFLYFESSALLLYWTMNNLFSLGKNFIEEKFDISKFKEKSASFLTLPFIKIKNNKTLKFISTNIFAQAIILFFGTIFIYKAIPIAASDTGMYSVDYLSVVVYLLGFFTLSVVLSVIIYYFLSKKLRSIVTILATFGALSGLFFAFIMPFEMGPLNAMAMPDFQYFGSTGYKLVKLLLLLLLMTVWFFIFKKIKKVVWIVILSANILLMVQTFSMGINPKEINRMAVKDTTQMPLEQANKFYAFSKESNTIVIMMDEFQGNIFADIIVKHPEIKQQLSGFVYYPNTLSHGAHTRLSLSAITGGAEFQTQLMHRRDDYKKLKTESWDLPYVPKNVPYLKNMAMAEKYKHSYSFFNPHFSECEIFSIYSDAICTRKVIISNNLLEQKKQVLSIKTGKYGPNFETAKFFSELSLLFSLPHMVKPRISSFLGISTTFGYPHAIKEYSQLTNMTEFSNSKSNKKTSKFIHNTFTHKEWMVNNNCQIVDRYFTGYQGLFNAGYCSIKLLSNFFVKLKKLGIYDKTKIIIVSDHGSYGRNIKANSKKFNILEPGASALMLVKDFNQSGDLKTSMQFMSNMDTYGIALSGVSEGMEVKLDKIKNPEDNRSLIFIKRTEPMTSYNIKKAFRVKGNIFDEKNWQELSEKDIQAISTE